MRCMFVHLTPALRVVSDHKTPGPFPSGGPVWSGAVMRAYAIPVSPRCKLIKGTGATPYVAPPHSSADQWGGGKGWSPNQAQ